MFDVKSPRISAYSIHEWIFETLHIAEEDLLMIQIDGPRRHVYIKYKHPEPMLTMLNEAKGGKEYRHENGEISIVHIEPAGMGMRQVRIANLPPEINNRTISSTLMKFGEIKEIKDEVWSKSYRYKISNGIRIVNMQLKDHIPSYTTIAGHKVQISYEGQPATCFGCSKQGHNLQDCPTRKPRTMQHMDKATTSGSQIVKSGNAPTHAPIANLCPSNDSTQDTNHSSTNNTKDAELNKIIPKTIPTTITQHKENEKQTPIPTPMETESTQQPSRESNNPQDPENQKGGGTTRMDENATHCEQHHPQQADIENTEPQFPQETALDQQDGKVRTGISSISTSDDETTINKSQTNSKRLKKQKTMKETGQMREIRRSLDRQRKTQRM
jgi:hypothetical protein